MIHARCSVHVLRREEERYGVEQKKEAISIRKENRATGRTLPDRAFFSLSISLQTPERAEQEDLSLNFLSKKRTHVEIRERAGRARCMGLLDQLWDDTVAGPRPDSGLGKLRKYASFSPSSSSSVSAAAASPPAAEGASRAVPVPPVTRSITMLRPSALSVATSPRSESSSAPSSPASGAPDSPFGAATTPKGEGWKKLRRKGRMAAADGADTPGTPRSPTVYDWVVISSLDR
uniref:Uncharacterized protein n=2 Tax=Setaria TaxID=4554 RepID=K3ZWL5_SETIT